MDYFVLLFQILLNYAASIGFPKNEYKMFSGWPRKDVRKLIIELCCIIVVMFLFFLQLTAMDLESTLQDIKMCAQEVLILEER